MNNLDELNKELTEMIVSSDIVINRREFRTMYFVNDLKKQRKTKLLNLINSCNEMNKEKEFSECEYFMSISKISEMFYAVVFNTDWFDKFKLEINKIELNQNNFLLDDIIKNLLCEKFSFDSHTELYVVKTFNPIRNIKSFHRYQYKNPAEDRTLMFSFSKYNFDILNKYSYKQIVRLFKNV